MGLIRSSNLTVPGRAILPRSAATTPWLLFKSSIFIDEDKTAKGDDEKSKCLNSRVSHFQLGADYLCAIDQVSAVPRGIIITRSLCARFFSAVHGISNHLKIACLDSCFLITNSLLDRWSKLYSRMLDVGHFSRLGSYAHNHSPAPLINWLLPTLIQWASL